MRRPLSSPAILLILGIVLTAIGLWMAISPACAAVPRPAPGPAPTPVRPPAAKHPAPVPSTGILPVLVTVDGGLC